MKRSLVSQFGDLAPISLPVLRDLSVSVCLLFTLVEVYTDPAHIRGGGGLHLVWTLRGMRARGNMVWGSRGIAWGWWLEKWVLRADSQLEVEAQTFLGALQSYQSLCLDSFHHGPPQRFGAKAWWPRGSAAQWMGAVFPAFGKTKSRSGSKTKAKETWKHLTALIHHGPSFFLCSHYICL